MKVLKWNWIELQSCPNNKPHRLLYPEVGKDFQLNVSDYERNNPSNMMWHFPPNITHILSYLLLSDDTKWDLIQDVGSVLKTLI